MCWRDGMREGDQGWWDDWVAFLQPWGFDLSAIRVPVAAVSQIPGASRPARTLTKVTGTWARTRARDRIAAIGAEPLDAMHLRRQVLEVLRERQADGQPRETLGAATIVVTIEEISAADRLDLFARAIGLTTRENELLSLLATGSDTRAMARQMSLSEHTVQDHLKSIFAKTGAPTGSPCCPAPSVPGPRQKIEPGTNSRPAGG